MIFNLWSAPVFGKHVSPRSSPKTNFFQGLERKLIVPNCWGHSCTRSLSSVIRSQSKSKMWVSSIQSWQLLIVENIMLYYRITYYYTYNYYSIIPSWLLLLMGLPTLSLTVPSIVMIYWCGFLSSPFLIFFFFINIWLLWSIGFGWNINLDTRMITPSMTTSSMSLM